MSKTKKPTPEIISSEENAFPEIVLNKELEQPCEKPSINCRHCTQYSCEILSSHVKEDGHISPSTIRVQDICHLCGFCPAPRIVYGE